MSLQCAGDAGLLSSALPSSQASEVVRFTRRAQLLGHVVGRSWSWSWSWSCRWAPFGCNLGHAITSALRQLDGALNVFGLRGLCRHPLRSSSSRSTALRVVDAWQPGPIIDLEFGHPVRQDAGRQGCQRTSRSTRTRMRARAARSFRALDPVSVDSGLPDTHAAGNGSRWATGGQTSRRNPCAPSHLRLELHRRTVLLQPGCHVHEVVEALLSPGRGRRILVPVGR